MTSTIEKNVPAIESLSGAVDSPNQALIDANAKIERLELLSVAMDLENFGTRRLALQIKIQQLQAEANLVNQELTEATAKGQSMLETFQKAYGAYKVKLEIPEGKEINLRTGEVVDTPPSSQQVPSSS